MARGNEWSQFERRLPEEVREQAQVMAEGMAASHLRGIWRTLRDMGLDVGESVALIQRTLARVAEEEEAAR